MPNKKREVNIGDKFGFWEVISGPIYRLYGIKNPQKTQFINVKCVCGKKREIRARILLQNQSKSCGCKQKYFCSLNSGNRIHGEWNSRLYTTWSGMKQRCNNPKASKYYLYGGKGIKICDEWLNYTKFRNWALNNGYNDVLTINRKNSNLGYYPENCEWVTKEENNNVIKWRDKKIESLENENKILKQKLVDLLNS